MYKKFSNFFFDQQLEFKVKRRLVILIIISNLLSKGGPTYNSIEDMANLLLQYAFPRKADSSGMECSLKGTIKNDSFIYY